MEIDWTIEGIYKKVDKYDGKIINMSSECLLINGRHSLSGVGNVCRSKWKKDKTRGEILSISLFIIYSSG